MAKPAAAKTPRAAVGGNMAIAVSTMTPPETSRRNPTSFILIS
jgi:hypothetical protein